MTTKSENGQASLAAFDERQLREAFGKYTTGVTIVTADIRGKRVGMTANSFSSLSLNPPLVLWSVRRSSTNFDDFMEATHFAVNVLSTAQIELSQRFAKSSPHKFDGVTHGTGIGGSPIFEDAAVIFECRTDALHEAGDHVIMIGRVEKLTVSDHRALAFSEGRYSASVEHPSTRAAVRGAGPNGDTGDPMRQFVSVLLLRAYNRMSDEMAELHEEEDITTNESRILHMVATYPARSLSNHMPVLYLTEVAAEDALQNLIGKGFVSQDDKGLLSATASGKEKSRRVLKGLALLEAKFLKDVPGIQVDLLKHTLVDIIDAEI